MVDDNEPTTPEHNSTSEFDLPDFGPIYAKPPKVPKKVKRSKTKTPPSMEDLPSLSMTLETPKAQHKVARKNYARDDLEKLIVHHLHDPSFQPEEGDSIPIHHGNISGDLRGVGVELFHFHDCRFVGTKLDRHAIEMLTDAIEEGEIIIEGIDLSSANLASKVTFKPELGLTVMLRFSLQHLPLQKTDFHNASLHNATLAHSNLENANFTDAFLESTNLSHTNLTNATFTYASLHNAIFTGADLSGADFRNCEQLHPMQLVNAKNIEQAIFTNPDIVKEALEIREGQESLTFKSFIAMTKNFLFEEKSSEEAK